MRALRTRLYPLAALAIAATAIASAHAQDAAAPQPLPHVSLHPESQAPAPAQPPAAQSPSTPAQADAPPEPAPANDAAQSEAGPGPTSVSSKAVVGDGYVKGPKNKEVYVGPADIIVLAPTPMLDEEGKQRLDPDGKLMWNPAVKQQRDKRGHPLFENGKPVFQTASELGYDEHGKKLHLAKVKPPKMTPVDISRGTFTVDGVIGKAELNYNIADLKYLYFYVPTVGVTVVSNEPFPGASPQKDAFSGNTLTVKVDDHTLQLASDKGLLGKHPEIAYVLVNRSFSLPSKFPVVGYGTLRVAPYQWPGSRPNAALADVVAPPPIPADLRPVMLLSACPKGQMRMPAPAVLPGQTAPPQPCVPIAQAQAALTAMKAKSAATFAVTSAPASAKQPSAGATQP